ncbi:MAG: phosphoribosylanthranilate isomerase [Pseudanabaenaceae cyanobacterium bins.39]|nr:phosphoribosylanthranilate isomerase [Pseudanabaenaceae cyanobacterium bins.39]
MYIKICGITKLNQAIAIAKMGANALGFICASSSPRYIQPQAIAHIISNLQSQLQHESPPFLPLPDFVGVFVNADIEQILQTVSETGLTAIQLHGGESVSYCQELRSQLEQTSQIPSSIKLIKALRIRDRQSLEQAKIYQQAVDILLLDAYDPHIEGGTGKTIDWQLLHDFHQEMHLDWWLAGGLSPDNVTEAIALTNPDGLDISSGVEIKAGDKDLAKVKQFLALASKA